MNKLPLDQRPRERLLAQGATTLSDAELLAIILGHGTRGKPALALAYELLTTYGSLAALADTPLTSLTATKGLGPAKAATLKAALTLGSRSTRSPPKTLPKIATADDAYHLVRHAFQHHKQELFGVILLNTRLHLITWEIISVGTLTQTLAHPREIFATALRHSAASLILVHNHPSGDPTPSPQDHTLTTRLLEAAKCMGIPLLDHLIISDAGYTSCLLTPTSANFKV